MAKAKKSKKREKLIDVIKRELRSRGYEEVEPNPQGGGVWSRSGEQWTDKILPTVQDCFEREDDDAR